jgi:Trk K+ transport system NAD-binding subunit
MIAEMGKKLFHLPVVFVRLTDPAKEQLLEGLGIMTIYPVSLSIQNSPGRAVYRSGRRLGFYENTYRRRTCRG